MGRLRRHLAETGLDQSTCLAFTADHGESLGEHGERTHGFLAYNTTIWIPLIISPPGLPPGRVERNVSHIDIFPTLCDVLGVSKPEVLQGVSLLPAMKGQRDSRSEPIYFVSLSPFYSMGWAPIRGYIQGREKFIDSPVPELYDLTSDFREARNIADKRSIALGRKTLGELIDAQSSKTAEGAGR